MDRKSAAFFELAAILFIYHCILAICSVGLNVRMATAGGNLLTFVRIDWFVIVVSKSRCIAHFQQQGSPW